VEKNPTIVNFPVKGIEFGEFLTDEAKEKYKDVSTTYDLIANVVHEGSPKDGTYKAHILHRGDPFKLFTRVGTKVGVLRDSHNLTMTFIFE
jgi:hypothetical protein